MDTATIISSRGQIDEDPEKEVAALQYIKANGPHASVIEITEVSSLTKDDWMPTWSCSSSKSRKVFDKKHVFPPVDGFDVSVAREAIARF